MICRFQLVPQHLSPRVSSNGAKSMKRPFVVRKINTKRFVSEFGECSSGASFLETNFID
jgi:hypothetical protein